jgi:histidinol phosphatase-like PHP family hydrolase
MRYGVEQARRAGLTAEDVLNTLPFERFWAAIRR